MSVAWCRELVARPSRRSVARSAVIVGFALALAAPSAPAAETRALRQLSGAGTWRVVQVYNDIAFIDFTHAISFGLRPGRTVRVPLDGRAVKAPLTIRVRSTATGAYGDVDGNAVPYACSATSTTKAPGTLRIKRRAGGWTVAVRVLRELNPGDPECGADDGVITWPSGGELLADAFDLRVRVGAAGLRRAVALEWPQTTNDCSQPFLVGVCGEQLAWSGTLRLRP